VAVPVASQVSAEELRLWADYYEARARALEIMSREGTAGEALTQILAEESLADSSLARIKELLGIAPS
jgi:hypothetical protein